MRIAAVGHRSHPATSLALMSAPCESSASAHFSRSFSVLPARLQASGAQREQVVSVHDAQREQVVSSANKWCRREQVVLSANKWCQRNAAGRANRHSRHQLGRKGDRPGLLLLCPLSCASPPLPPSSLSLPCLLLPPPLTLADPPASTSLSLPPLSPLWHSPAKTDRSTRAALKIVHATNIDCPPTEWP